MKLKFIGLSIAAGFASSFAFLLHAAAPTPAIGLSVDITSPSDRSHVPWQSQVPYAVTATYDGKSTKFGELLSQYVVLRASFVPNADAPSLESAGALPEGIIEVSRSNCTGCHDFAANSAGPSFAAIAKRYAGHGDAVAMLAEHIRNGSTGTWGRGSMPPHPDMSVAQSSAVAKWIVSEGDDASLQYAVGKSGTVRMSAPQKPGPRAGIVLSAFYTGPLKAGDKPNLAAGHNRVVIYGAHP